MTIVIYILYHKLLTFPAERSCALVLLQADEGAGPPVGVGTVPARIGGHGDLAERGRGRVADSVDAWIRAEIRI